MKKAFYFDLFFVLFFAIHIRRSALSSVGVMSKSETKNDTQTKEIHFTLEVLNCVS